MFKKIAAVVGAAALVSVLGLFVVGTVFAEGPTPTPSAGTPGNAPPGRGFWGGVCRGAGVVSDAVTKLLGMTREQIFAERATGKMLAQIAKEKGVTDQQVIDAMVAGQQAAIDQALKDGKITQAQADWLVARMKAMAPFELSNPFTPKGGHQGGLRGMKGDQRHEGRAPNGQDGKATPTPAATKGS